MPTREQIEQGILDTLRETPRVSIFWATENQQRAHAMDRLESSGRIVRRRDKESGYPWMVFDVAEEL